MNIWHDIKDERITPEEFIAVIEIPRGSRKKYEIDKETGMIIMDRIEKTNFVYPANYGFIPRTLSDDGDPLDVLVITNESIDPLVLVQCKPIGIIEMIDNGERDEKILAVPLDCPWFGQTNDINDLAKDVVPGIEHFFKHYKDLKKRNKVEVKPAQNRAAALKVIAEAKKLYNKNFGGSKK